MFFLLLEQDILYLNDYARASVHIAGKSEHSEQLKFFLELAQSSFIEQERIHAKYIAQDNYLKKNQVTPAYKNYSQFILYHTATKPLALAYASIIALCFRRRVFLSKNIF